MKRGRDIAAFFFFTPINKRVRESQGIERAEELEEGEPEELVEVGEVMKGRTLTKRGTSQGVRLEKRVRRKKTYRDRERNSQRDSN